MFSSSTPPAVVSIPCSKNWGWTAKPLNGLHFQLRAAAAASSSSKDEIGLVPNATRWDRASREKRWDVGFSLGVDLGHSRTGLAKSKGYCVSPLTVLKLRGQELENRLLRIAEKEEADEFIIGLPTSNFKETTQSNIVRSIAGRLAVLAAHRGWRVYLQDEHGSTQYAMKRMINRGLSKHSRREKVDSYAALVILERYFSMRGETAELVMPKQLELQQKLWKGPLKKDDFLEEEEEDIFSEWEHDSFGFFP
ncbi:hypothetical protein Droror1_Dr00000804 [Drosera rotundifolia]